MDNFFKHFLRFSLLCSIVGLVCVVIVELLSDHNVEFKQKIVVESKQVNYNLFADEPIYRVEYSYAGKNKTTDFMSVTKDFYDDVEIGDTIILKME